jgi:hypothetical protein
MSVCPHVSARLLTAQIFVKFDIGNVNQNLSKQIQIWLKSDNNRLFEHFSTSIFLTADNSAKGIHYCIPMAKHYVLILLKATHRSSIMWTYCCETMITQTRQCYVSALHRLSRWALASVHSKPSFLWDNAPARIRTPDRPASNLVTIPTTLSTVEAESVEIFVFLEGPSKKQTQNVGIIIYS